MPGTNADTRNTAEKKTSKTFAHGAYVLERERKIVNENVNK